MSDATLDASGAKPISRVGKIAFVAFLTLVSLGTLTVMAPLLVLLKFSLPSASMQPTLQIGDHVLATHIAYDSNLERGDVVVFRSSDVIFAKRIVGLPGERVALRDGQLIINGIPVERRSVGDREYGDDFVTQRVFEETLPGGRKIEVLDDRSDGPYDNFEEMTVPADHYFVLGDNRDNSYDSRALGKIGFVARADMVGKIKFIHFSMGDRGLRLDRMGRFVN